MPTAICFSLERHLLTHSQNADFTPGELVGSTRCGRRYFCEAFPLGFANIRRTVVFCARCLGCAAPTIYENGGTIAEAVLKEKS
jgi:hypothetical protein